MLNIVIPMAGRGKRFSDAGYAEPKPLIPVDGKRMIERVVENLTPRRPHRFVFICLEEHLADGRLAELLARCAPGHVVVPTTGVTEGAACSVLLARAWFDGEEPLMIANCDQWVGASIDDYLEGFDRSGLDGYIMTMRDRHPKWSYVRLDGPVVTEVVEKQVVSDEATVGIYNFRRGRDYIESAEDMIARDLRVNGEFYVAPVYNSLIARGGRVGIFNVGGVGTGDGMYGLGVPEDLENFLRIRPYAAREGGGG